MPDPSVRAGEARLTITADVGYLVVIRRFVQVAAAQRGLADRAVEDVVHAVDELSANIILHGYAAAPGLIAVRCWAEAGALHISLRDQAPAFDPTTRPDPNLDVPLEQRPVGGLGIFLSRKMLDDLRYQRLPSGENLLTLVKRLPGPA
ncbi:MAG: ATP-binding protein [Anaerolineales bacterium]|nr:ATP-binding protein [Anaerolineales bacterium]